VKKLVTIFLLIFSLAAAAQHKNIPLNRQSFTYSLQYLTRHNTPADSIIHTSFRPLVESQGLSLPRYIYNNSGRAAMINAGWKFKEKEGAIYQHPEYISKDPDRFRSSNAPAGTYLHAKLKAESFIWVQPKITSEDQLPFNLTIDPLFDLETGKSPQDTSQARLFRNTRGVLVRGDIGKQFSFETSFYENQARYTDYISEFIDSSGVAPGQGRVKTFKSHGYDFAMAAGYVSYSPGTHVNIQLGHGKHFVGDGYRSLLLSDNAFNYPYARVTTTFGKIQYVNLYTSFMNLTDGGVTAPPNTERLFQKKAGAFQMLSYAPHKRVLIGLFQGMIWEASDNKNKQHFNFNYFDPVIGVSAATQGMGSTNNVLLGATLKLKITKGILLYGQGMIDDIATEGLKGSIRNKTGYQAGFYAFDLLKIRNLNLQAEYNSVRPYAYSHKKPQQSYTHYSQPLAHPLGANFNETTGIISYRISDLVFEMKYSYARTSAVTF
jgi:hypothetical protein